MDRATEHGTTASRSWKITAWAAAAGWIAVLSVALPAQSGRSGHSAAATASNANGVVATFSSSGAIDRDNPFFQDLGTNGRSCFSCHRPDQAWTITPSELRERFDDSRGLDPVFRSNDGSNCAGADVSTLQARREAFSLLLSKGLIRIGLTVPAGAEFDVVDVDDPYACGAAFDSVSMYRRPLPTANMAFLSAVMWDGRQTAPARAIRDDLLTQALDAITTHAQGGPVPESTLREIVDFELAIFTAQEHGHGAGSLSHGGVHGGPRKLASQPFCIGVNDPLDMLPAVPGACEESSGGLDPRVFTLFDGWAMSSSPERAAIARGQVIFNTRQFVIDDVAGLNGGPRDPVAGPIAAGTCTICHDTPNAGNHSVAMALNIGIADAGKRTPDLPLYTLRNRATGAIRQTTDPGRAMITGRWNDIGKFKGPVLRALAARAPYFHNGAAATLDEAIEFYDTRFQIGFTAREKADLLAFLRAL